MKAFRDFSGLLRCLAAVIRELKCQCETHRSAVRVFQPAVVPQLHTSFNTHVLYRVRRSHLWRDAKQNFPNMKHYIPNTVSLVNMFSWVLWKVPNSDLGAVLQSYTGSDLIDCSWKQCSTSNANSKDFYHHYHVQSLRVLFWGHSYYIFTPKQHSEVTSKKLFFS